MKTPEEKRARRERFITHGGYLVAVAILLLLLKCSDQKSDRQVAGYTAIIEQKDSEVNSLKQMVADLESRKAIPVVVDGVKKNSETGKVVGAIIVPLSDKRETSLFIKDVVKRVPYKVPVPCPPKEVETSQVQQPCPPCPPQKEDLTVVKKVVSPEVNNNANDSTKINVNLSKTAQDSTKVLFGKRFSLNDNPKINFEEKYIEYLPNPYRIKAQKNFWTGVGLAGASAMLYGASEAIGHPQFFDDRDNTGAKQLHNQIKYLRIGSAVMAGASLLEFGRAVHFHNMEAKFIINPTTIGLKINLDSPSKK